MQSVIDISDISTISETAYPTTPTYTFKNPTNQYVLLSQIAMGFNSGFISNGKIQMKINGNVITSAGSANQEVGVTANITIDFKDSDFVVLEPNNDVTINARVTSSSGTIQCQVTGTQLTYDEYVLVRKKFLGL